MTATQGFHDHRVSDFTKVHLCTCVKWSFKFPNLQQYQNILIKFNFGLPFQALSKIVFVVWALLCINR